MLQKNVSYLLSPSPCDKETKLILMISSGHDNHKARDEWRQRISKLNSHIRHVFLVSSCSTCNHDLAHEHDMYHDIVHTSLEDGHRRLGYKILSGYIWSYLHCQEAEHVVKTDDNVVMDMEALMSMTSHQMPKNSVTCGSGTPHRNMKTLR